MTQLRRSAGALLLWGLGVGYVVSGDYFGWNFGLRAGGWGGLAVATVVMATMYVAMIFSLAELATAMPVAGGPYAFARRAMGPWGGYLCGLAVTIEYVIAPVVIASGIAGYAAGMLSIESAAFVRWVPLCAYVVFVGLSLLGARFSLGLLFAITALAVLALVVWAIAMVPAFDGARLGAGGAFPRGSEGVLAALPAAAWFYLAVEGVPLAAEETRDPVRDLPRGMIAAMLSLVALSAVVLVLAPGVAGTRAIGEAANPLPTAAEAAHGRGVVFWIATLVGLVGLVASFFSILFAYSRQIFALARAGYFPPVLARTNRFHAPDCALIVPAIVGLATLEAVERWNTSTVPTGDLLMQVAVFAALVSYVMMTASHVLLRVREPAMPRPYRTPGGAATSGTALVLALVAATATLFYGQAASLAVLGTAAVLALGLAYFALVARRRVVGIAPETEAARVRAAESELSG